MYGIYGSVVEKNRSDDHLRGTVRGFCIEKERFVVVRVQTRKIECTNLCLVEQYAFPNLQLNRIPLKFFDLNETEFLDSHQLVYGEFR